MVPDNITVRDLLPHRGRMLLINKVIDLDAQRAVASAVVSEDWPLVEDNQASCLLLLELVAQTAGITNTWSLLQQQGPGCDTRGWIVGIKTACFHVDRLDMGTEIIVEAYNSFEFESFREISGTASVAGNRVAEVTLQLMRAGADSSVE